MCVCLHMCVYLCVCVCLYVCLCVCVCVCTCVHTCVCFCTCLCVTPCFPVTLTKELAATLLPLLQEERPNGCRVPALDGTCDAEPTAPVTSPR